MRLDIVCQVLLRGDELRDLPEMLWIYGVLPSIIASFRRSSLSVLIQACEGGLDLALLPSFVGAKKELVRWCARAEVLRGRWLLSPRDQTRTRRIRPVAE